MVRINRQSTWVKSCFWGFASLWTLIVGADTKMTAEGGAIRILSYAARDFQFSHGQSPTNWAQLAEFRDIEEINRATFPIKQHYVFIVFNKIPLPDSEKGDVFLIRTYPSTNTPSGEAGRYIVSRNGVDFIPTWLSENKVQQMLADAGITELPKPDLPSVSKEPSPAIVPNPAQTTTSPSAPRDDKQPQATHQNVANSSAPKNDESNASNTVPVLVGTATPASGTSWLGMAVVLGMGFFVAVFLLVRAKQK